jgi:tryptophan-rich sensory protein
MPVHASRRVNESSCRRAQEDFLSEIATPSQLRQSFLRRAFVTVPLIILLGTASGILSGSGWSNLWFQALIKPKGIPSGATFGLVWTLLYVLMGLAVAMILHARRARGRSIAMALFVIQLLLNLAWSPMFFGFHKIQLAFWLLLAILILAAATAYAFWRIRRMAGLILLPYLLWLCFAGTLSYKIARLNPHGARAAETHEIAL